MRYIIEWQENKNLVFKFDRLEFDERFNNAIIGFIGIPIFQEIMGGKSFELKYARGIIKYTKKFFEKQLIKSQSIFRLIPDEV